MFPRRLVRCALALGLFAVGCDTEIPIGNLARANPTGGTAGAESVPSAPVPDASPPDASLPDTSPPDASVVSRQDAVALFDFRNGATVPYDDQRGSLTLDAAEGSDPALLQPGEAGLTFVPGGILVSETAAEDITRACMATNELTIEVWTTPEGPQDTRSRLVTVSADVEHRNFALGIGTGDGGAGVGQCADVSRAAFGAGTGTEAYYFRRRLGNEDCVTCELNGYPELWTPFVAEDRLTHVVATHAADGSDRIYLDATVQGECNSSGDFAEWDDTYRLEVGGELLGGDRPFAGVLHLVAIYDRALSPAEVNALFLDGI